MRGKKPVNDLSLVRFPWQLIYIKVFQPNFAEMTENDHKFKLQSFRITAIAFKLLGIIRRFLYFSEK